eukprot:15441479-Alexandrium_andersonii.AAC.1
MAYGKALVGGSPLPELDKGRGDCSTDDSPKIVEGKHCYVSPGVACAPPFPCHPTAPIEPDCDCPGVASGEGLVEDD